VNISRYELASNLLERGIGSESKVPLMNTQPVSNIRTLRRSAAGENGPRRVRTNWPARIKAGSRRASCTVIDMSGAGACLSCTGRLEQGDPMWLVIDRFPPISATVAWRNRDRAGVRFRENQDWFARVQKQRFDPAAWLETESAGEK
jgi:hypothetical protein